ncbi:hypothetical protein BGZ72_009716, partial [Mortierella alpina]
MTLAEIECCIIESVMKVGMDSKCCQDLIPPGTVLSRFARYDSPRICSTEPSSRVEDGNTTACCTKHAEMIHSGGCCEDAPNADSPCSPAPAAPPATTPTISAAL